MGRSGRLVRAYLPIFLYLTYNLRLCNAKDTITSIQYITDPETVVSTGAGTFKLGFFSPGNSTNRYIGIWYNNIPGPTVVWVANRETPLTDSSGVMKISENGNLVVLDGQKNVVWSTNVSNTAKNSSAELLDSGNLVLRAGISDNSTLWESFDHPTDTFLPTMKLWAYSRTNEKQLLKSWKAVSDPSIGSFSVGILPLNIPQALIWNGSHPHWRSGPWNSRVFIGVPNMNNVYLDGLSVVKDEGDQSVYLTFSYIDQLRKFVLDPEGNLLLSRWDRETSEWVVFWLALNNDCDIYGNCGPFGSCDALKSPICSCLSGFEPKSAEEWSRGNWSGGCVRRTQLQCERNITSGEKGKEDGFLKLEYMKVPDFAVWSPAPENVEECEEECLRNCSCVAYAHDSNGIGCMSWSGNLIDIQKFSTAGVDLYIRVADSELDKRRDPKVIIISTVVIGMVTMSVFIYCSLRWIAKQRGRKKEGMGMPLFDLGERELSDANMLNNMTQGKGSELPLFSFEILAKATNNFHGGNKLGKGGFGEVHKGKLPNGQEIAVKRLSKSSGQGIEEFTNEVIVISKLQHKNLVRLLGCCIEGEEKMLIYEYMPNKSLDAFLFDPTQGSLLDWNKCFHIIEGIIRGLLYLHRDSRLRIIHRDLKASNILLDEELNPKISDFGMARIFGGTQDEANTRRVVGTYGYMSPEYAMEGRFSEKSDVFSFGVLLLEIVSRKRNTSFNHHPEFLSLLGYVWKLWNEDNVLELIDQGLYESRFETDILKCIHVGLLCIQESTKDRPTMSTIVSMLGSDIASLPTPKQPAYTERQIASDTDSFQKSPKTCSINTVSVTVIEGR